jgi:hypothetical protein
VRGRICGKNSPRAHAREKRTPGAEARTHFQRLNGTIEIVPFPSPFMNRFTDSDYKAWLKNTGRQHSTSNLFHFLGWISNKIDNPGTAP